LKVWYKQIYQMLPSECLRLSVSQDVTGEVVMSLADSTGQTVDQLSIETIQRSCLLSSLMETCGYLALPFNIVQFNAWRSRQVLSLEDTCALAMVWSLRECSFSLTYTYTIVYDISSSSQLMKGLALKSAEHLSTRRTCALNLTRSCTGC
jgi:hypothetical protein